MVKIHSNIQVDVFDEITQYGENNVQQLLKKFSKAMGVPIEVKIPLNFNDAKVFINGVPNSLYLARMCDIDDNSHGIALFAKPKTSGPDYDCNYNPGIFYSPYTLAAKSAVEGLDNKMFLLGHDDKMQTISFAPLEGSDRDAIAERLKRKYRVRNRSNNRFVVFFAESRFSYPCVWGIYRKCVATLFDRQNVDQVRKLVTRQRDANGKMQEVVRYCMEPVLCQVANDEESTSYNLAIEYLNRTGCNDKKLTAQIDKYRNRIKYANGWRRFGGLFWGFCRGREIVGNHPFEGMITWLHLDI